MRVVSITNQKGGTGKTSTAVNLAAALACDHGQRVLLIDMDPQANASSWLGVRDGGKGLLTALACDQPLVALAQQSSIAGVDLIPSSEWLIRLEPMLVGSDDAQLCFRNALAAVPGDRWDLAIVDCTPSLGLLVVSVLAAAHEVLIPVELHSMPVEGVAKIAKTIERVRAHLNPALRIGGVLPVRAQPKTRVYRHLRRRLAETFGDRFLATAIRQDIRMAEAHSFRQPINEHSPDCAAAADYRQLAAELMTRWQTPSRGETEWAA